MELFFIAAVTLLASGLTFVSGFGLGTLLTPMFALVYPLPVAIFAGAVVHFANNVFKCILMARFTDWDVVTRFGVPAAIASVAGALLLTLSHAQPALMNYTLGAQVFSVSLTGLMIGPVIVLFAWLELSKRLEQFIIPTRLLPLGGVLSGFFGGLSGNQGALRNAFLMKSGLSKEALIASGVICAMFIDIVRLLVYDALLLPLPFDGTRGMVAPIAVATIFAVLGSALGKRLLPKVTVPFFQNLVAAFMLIIGLLLTIGLL
jgi:uncharacterized membrane protein YfcA